MKLLTKEIIEKFKKYPFGSQDNKKGMDKKSWSSSLIHMVLGLGLSLKHKKKTEIGLCMASRNLVMVMNGVMYRSMN